MLLRFGVGNHRSLRDRQELSLVASSLGDNAEGLIPCRHAPGGKLLPVVVIYGANASGKSNLIGAIRWMRSTVLYSHSRGEPDGPIAREAFSLDPAIGGFPSRFDADFVVNDVRYHYGFEATDKAFASEWLFAFPHEKRQVLFEREGMEFRFGRHLKGRNQTISELTRPNSLFLSAAAQNGHEELTKVSRYFQGMTVDEVRRNKLAARLSRQPKDRRIITFLSDSATGIVDYRVHKSDFNQKTGVFLRFLTKEEPTVGNSEKSFVKDYEDSLVFDLRLGHQSIGGDPIYFELSQESDGTQRLISLLLPVFDALDAGGIMVVDELDASLHTHACELLLGLFSSPATNPKGAQLIATTHDTNLLASRHLRRDQVWLTEKDAEGATHLYPLTDFRTRKNDNLARGYLQGRYGAVPFSGRLPDILADS